MGIPLSKEDEYQTLEVKARREEDERQVEQGTLEYAKRRYKICKECPEFNSIVKVCTECYCFMPAKVLIKEINCPLGRWRSEVQDDVSSYEDS